MYSYVLFSSIFLCLSFLSSFLSLLFFLSLFLHLFINDAIFIGKFCLLQAREGGPPKCRQSKMHCDVDKCVNPAQMCDGTAQCDDGIDEAEGYCSH